ncbi:MAG: Anthranilate phosphoribosyltransferase [uncultured Propionibacteriaceae bacterium]|uniref:Anthranilate phosphoribosyltransferase n=1 Tax=uncultured Propionibacteriaceae bacterium TaxID=257457 RepID=A0A6J4NSJ9_9ACTN|nr:MAG: Anthranilate phosphoribosyltransferase [uncultured Propionibacteriaceae bacterium]
MSWPELLTGLVRGEDQSREATAWAMSAILAGDSTPAQLAAFVVALRAKGETVAEMSGLADTMIDFATPIEIPGDAVDVVGSGGDRANTVNVSTMAAIVAAGAGARVVKHGNRAASSACGAADVLEALGVVLDLTAAQQQRVIQQTGIGFLFAPHYHPALRHAAAPRRELGIATTFNFLGPLANPAQPNAAAVGVADAAMAELMAGVFAARGAQGLVFHGDDGLDELTTTTTSTVWVVADGRVSRTELDPVELGIPRARVEDLVGGDAARNAAVVTDVMAGKQGPVRDIVVLNAAAALAAYAKPVEPAQLADQLRGEVARASESIDSGAAEAKLSEWVAATQAARRLPGD